MLHMRVMLIHVGVIYTGDVTYTGDVPYATLAFS